MSELRPDVRAFLETTRSAHLADRGDRTRSRLALEARLLLPPLALAAASASAPALAPSTVAAELRLVREAQAQLRAGQTERALASLAEHARLYPQGVLREERAAARVLALCSLGRGEQARVEAEAFARVAPRSPYAGGLRRPCGR
jgi:outer membrane protein assembly factor BamD (BamD/ComL family)